MIGRFWIGRRVQIHHRSLYGKESGQTLVEFALTMGISLLILFAIIDLGRAVYTLSVIRAAAQEGSRYGIIHPNNRQGIENAVLERAIGLDPARFTIQVSRPSEREVQVNVSYVFQAVTPPIMVILPPNGELPLNASARMRRF